MNDVAGSLTNDTRQSPNESPLNDVQTEPATVMIEEFECSTCYKQFNKQKYLNAHLKANKPTDCKAITCKVDHDHDYKIIKFATVEEAKAFGKTFGTGFTLKSPANDSKNIKNTKYKMLINYYLALGYSGFYYIRHYQNKQSP